MPNKQFANPELAFLPLIAMIVARWALGGQPIFPSEFVIEDFILLLYLACFVVPLRFKRLIGLVISCLISTAMTLTWTPGSRKFFRWSCLRSLRFTLGSWR